MPAAPPQADSEAPVASALLEDAETGGPPEPDTDPAREIHWRRVIATALLCLGLVGAAGLLALKLAGARKHAVQRTRAASALAVRVHRAQVERITPRAVRFGRARARYATTLVAEIGATVSATASLFADGALLRAGAVALEFDRRDIELALRRAEAAVAEAEAVLERLARETERLRARRRIAEQTVLLRRAEAKRLADLYEKKLTNERERDAARLALLAAEDALAELDGRLAEQPAQIAAARQRLEQAHVERAARRLDLERTRVLAPFDGMINHLAVHRYERVAPGQTLFELEGIEEIEVPVALSLDDALLLAPEWLSAYGGAEPLSVSADAPSPPQIDAEVRYRGNGQTLRWAARLSHFEPLDAETQTLRAVVRLRNRAGSPALLPGTFCEVELQAARRVEGLAIPVEALQANDEVLVVRDGRLEVAEITPGLETGGWLFVRAGLEAGELVVTSPVDRPVPGTPVRVVKEAASSSSLTERHGAQKRP